MKKNRKVDGAGRASITIKLQPDIIDNLIAQYHRDQATSGDYTSLNNWIAGKIKQIAGEK
jgi:hypothetical protein